MRITTIPLRKIAKQILRSVDVLPGTSYRTMGVKWWGEGAYERETIDGSQTAAKTLSIVREGDLIINKIWVRHGSIAIAGKDVDGCAASGEFPTFELDLNEVLPRWLHWYTKTREFWDKCAQLSQGTSGKNRIKPDLFLAVEIPLLPLEEQRRVVARVEELVGKVEEVRSLRQKVNQEAQALLDSILHKVFVDEENVWMQLNVGSVAEIIDPNPSHRMPHYSEHGVTFISTVDFEGSESIRKKTAKYVTEETYDEQLKRCTFAIGDILYSRIGTIGQARILTEIWDFALSHVLVVVKPNRDIVLPRFLLWYLRSDSIIAQAANATRSVGVPDLGIKRIREFHIPVPPLPEQHCIVAYLDQLQSKVGAMRHLREQAMEELDALLPSILDKAFKGEL
ncbi:MAG: restriction endonuclease subunit S [Nostoc sp. JL34]|uniref:restriction endonuclease subunit S n=1 Tax=Nostoc sp. JL34 TaxID=2815397 RepID=UPI001DAB9CBB|nr:restriction endonuclease subunit S [Nostoc sp. JL34]MBN3885863.1 restriction endonuclease subunit S [Nostoc sp. JL34]